MKKILFMIPLLALLFTACDPTSEDNGPGANISAEELNNGFTITQESDGNNNLTFNISPARYVKIYNADNNGLVAQGTGSLTTQVVPPVTSANYYVEAINPDGSIVKSSSKGVTVNNYTKLPAIFDQVFGKDANGNYLTSTWTWDDSSDKCWGNGGWGSDQGPSWWGFNAGADLEGQASGKGLAGDGLPDAWFSLSLSEGVKTSRGETGTVTVNDEPSQQGWDIGTMTSLVLFLCWVYFQTMVMHVVTSIRLSRQLEINLSSQPSHHLVLKVGSCHSKRFLINKVIVVIII